MDALAQKSPLLPWRWFDGLFPPGRLRRVASSADREFPTSRGERAGDQRTRIARVSCSIVVIVRLPRIEDTRAIVAGVADIIVVDIRLVRVCGQRTVVADVTVRIVVAIFLPRIRSSCAIVELLEMAIAIRVGSGRRARIVVGNRVAVAIPARYRLSAAVLPCHEVIESDPWLRRLVFAAAATLAVAVVLYVIYTIVLRSGGQVA